VVKLWSVWPKLFECPVIGGVVRQLERASILVLMGVDAVSAQHRVAQHRTVVRIQVLLHHSPLRDFLCRGRCGAVRAARSPDYRLTVTNGDRTQVFTVADLRAMPQTTRRLPIACVEGWSANAEWTGVLLADLVATVGASGDSDVRMVSMERPGPYSRTVLPARRARDDMTLIALKINGETLNLDHGHPCRLIAPTRPGVLQTKWLTRIEVVG